MITAGGFVKLLDFGIAITDHASELTGAGFLLGSINYMSPEQGSGSKATSRSDLYSVGVTLYELTTGVLPITGSNNYEIMMGHTHKAPVPPHQVAPGISRVVSDAIMRALSKDPALRYATADEFLHALQIGPAAREEGATYTSPLPARTATPPSQPSTGSMQQKPLSSGLHSLPLEDISRKLAVYIGPVAKIVIKKLAAKSDDLDFIFREAAKHISSDSDRAAFLRSKRQ
jgi:serine/threonine protein kinase